MRKLITLIIVFISFTIHSKEILRISTIPDESMVLVLYGDVPLIKKETLNELISVSDESLTILCTIMENPHGYGRVKKDRTGFAQAIVEEKDASDYEKEIQEVFTGILCFVWVLHIYILTISKLKQH